jgi:Transcriptional regulator
LTDAGRAFLDEARAILKHTNEAVLKARTIGGKRETELHVGDFPLATARIMPGLLRDYQKAMPNVRVKLHDWAVEKELAGVTMVGCSLRSSFLHSRETGSVSSASKSY